MDLSLEQELSLRNFEIKARGLSQEQAQEFLVELYGQMLARENLYMKFIKFEWGLEPDPSEL